MSNRRQFDWDDEDGIEYRHHKPRRNRKAFDKRDPVFDRLREKQREQARDCERLAGQKEVIAEGLNVSLPDLSEETLLEVGVQHWNERNRPDGTNLAVLKSIDEHTLHRWAIAYLRHWAPYDAVRAAHAELGSDEIRALAFKQLLFYIAQKWPFLKDACEEELRRNNYIA